MASDSRSAARETFKLYLIKPSHYDDDGYVIQWVKTGIPSNTMAALYGIAQDCIERRALGDNVDIDIIAQDETATRIRPERIIRDIRRSGGKGLVALVGVQSNQYPRAVDIARPLRTAGIQVCIGGFHVSGCLSMLPKIPPEIVEAMDLGISIFAGEAEGRLDEVLQHAYRGQMETVYNYMSDLPGMEGTPVPYLPAETLKSNLSSRTSFDSGRGCPFQCSFCTIINVQGRKSRYRSADDIEDLLRANYAQGIKRFFITDDNFARNKNWEAVFDRIIKLRREEGMKFKFIIQVDTLCHRIPNFVRKAGLAGVNRVFIGLENVNPDNLIAAKKKQNRITEYRTMLQAWKSIGAITFAGYIIGFPNDTPDSVMRDIEIIKRELPVDFLEFFCLTPLPGSEDHQVLDAKGVPMDPDMNKYDTEHVTTDHPLMTREEFQQTYRRAWHAYYTPEHVQTIMRRAAACGMKPRTIARFTLWFYGSQAIEGVHPLQDGLFRLKYRKDRRPGMPIENPVVFYPRTVWEFLSHHARFARLFLTYRRLQREVEQDRNKANYRDIALSPTTEEDLETFEIFKSTASAEAAADKERRNIARRAEKVAAAE